VRENATTARAKKNTVSPSKGLEGARELHVRRVMRGLGVGKLKRKARLRTKIRVKSAFKAKEEESRN